jgi:hypothetical protein
MLAISHLRQSSPPFNSAEAVADADAVPHREIAAEVDGKGRAVEAVEAVAVAADVYGHGDGNEDGDGDGDADTDSDDKAVDPSVCLALLNMEEARNPHPVAPATAARPSRTGPGGSAAHSTAG